MLCASLSIVLLRPRAGGSCLCLCPLLSPRARRLDAVGLVFLKVVGQVVEDEGAALRDVDTHVPSDILGPAAQRCGAVAE